MTQPLSKGLIFLTELDSLLHILQLWDNIVLDLRLHPALLDEDIDPTADNPDIASPPEAVEGDGLDDTTWTGAAEDAEEEEE